MKYIPRLDSYWYVDPTLEMDAQHFNAVGKPSSRAQAKLTWLLNAMGLKQNTPLKLFSGLHFVWDHSNENVNLWINAFDEFASEELLEFNSACCLELIHAGSYEALTSIDVYIDQAVVKKQLSAYRTQLVAAEVLSCTCRYGRRWSFNATPYQYTTTTTFQSSVYTWYSFLVEAAGWLCFTPPNKSERTSQPRLDECCYRSCFWSTTGYQRTR